MGKTEVTGYDYKRKCPLDLSILQLGNGKPKIVMPWDPVKYLGVRLTITGDLTFERDYLCQEENARHHQTVDQAHVPPSADSLCGTGCAIIPIFRYSAAIANWNSQEIDKLENLWMRAFKKAWKVNASLPDVTFWAGPEQGVLEHQRLEPSLPVRPSAF